MSGCIGAQKRIVFMHNDFIGMFWDVSDNLWLKKVSLDDLRSKLKSSFNMRSVITYPEAHFKVWANWCIEFRHNQGEEHFMYHPRGRISYFPRINKFELVIDPCLINNTELVDRILNECGITRDNTRIVTQSDDQSLHYICYKCKPSSFDEKGRYLEQN